MTELNSTIQPLTEHVTDWRAGDVQVDFAQRLVANVVLSGGVSRNGHRYTAEALRQATPHYDRKPVFLDHAPNPARPFERSMRDLVGAVQNPRFVDGRIRGDIQVLDTEAGRTFLALVDAEHPTVGMSHVVLAQRGGDPNVVERIHDVVSVDAVVFPATTHGLREGGGCDNARFVGGVSRTVRCRARRALARDSRRRRRRPAARGVIRGVRVAGNR